MDTLCVSRYMLYMWMLQLSTIFPWLNTEGVACRERNEVTVSKPIAFISRVRLMRIRSEPYNSLLLMYQVTLGAGSEPRDVQLACISSSRPYFNLSMSIRGRSDGSSATITSLDFSSVVNRGASADT
uniref:Secreted protein n=1 Tax=Cacopsylla melanoneura TaxID=428564 RepID=A0A8D9B0S8_9HEMI